MIFPLKYHSFNSISFSDLAMFVTQAGRLSKDCQMQLNTVLDLQSRQSQLAAQVSVIFILYPIFTRHTTHEVKIFI